MTENILEIRNLSLAAVDENNRDRWILKDVSMDIAAGKITCLVGESGSGKSMTISSILGITPDTVWFKENSSIQFSGEKIFAVFQDPMNSFNQSIKTGRQMYEMAKSFRDVNREDFNRDICEVLKKLNFSEPERVLGQYPFELSGGMLQRLMIGCGIYIRPSLMIADEPTTALDVTVQKDILKTFRQINQQYGITILLVTHDFGVVAETADEVIVMEKGRVVEKGTVFEIFDHPQQVYTRQLIEATFKGEKTC